MGARVIGRRLALILVLGVAVWGAVAVLPAPPAHARLTLSQLQSLLVQARSKQEGLDRTVARLDAQLNVIDDRLAGINDRMASVSDTLQARETEYQRLHDDLIRKKQELQRAEQRLRWQQEVFEERVAQTYKAGEVNYLDVLLESTSYEDMLSRIRLIRELVAGDNDLVGDLTGTRDLVAVEKREIAADTLRARKLRDEVRARRDELASLRAEQLAAQASTQQARNAKKKALAAVEGNIRAWEAQEAQLAAESQGLAGVINGLAGTGDGNATGSMVWPCAGYVSSGFGWRVHPIFHVSKFHTGIDIGAGYGVPIKAADGGRVIYATWMSGYGNTIIVDHGGGLSTLYAHQSRLAVTSGPVSRGQVIGYVGSTGYSTGPHLHFEVRVNGNPVNPLGYLH